MKIQTKDTILKLKNIFELTSDAMKSSVNFEMSFWCLHIDQEANEIFERISALASEKRLNQKKERHFIFLITVRVPL